MSDLTSETLIKAVARAIDPEAFKPLPRNADDERDEVRCQILEAAMQGPARHKAHSVLAAIVQAAGLEPETLLDAALILRPLQTPDEDTPLEQGCRRACALLRALAKEPGNE